MSDAKLADVAKSPFDLANAEVEPSERDREWPEAVEMGALESGARLLAGLAWMGICVFFFSIILVLLLPFRQYRIRVSNLFGTIAGGGCAKISGSKIRLLNHEAALEAGPAIYVSNHTSVLDIFFGIWFSPWGTVGVGKKSIVYYPFFGQIYRLAGHLRIDRNDRKGAVAAMQKLTPFVRENNLSIFVWPEGRRARDGRLQPLKKGVAHMAMATGLPIVPMVVKGAHGAWQANTLRLHKAEIEIEFLDAIDTSRWTPENIDAQLIDLHGRFERTLPPSQRPAPGAPTNANPAKKDDKRTAPKA